MSLQMKKTLRTLTTVMVCLAIIFAFFISAIRIFGLEVYGVLTGSMEPTYPTGSLIYVSKVDPDELRVRDVITFSNSPTTIVTHRIVEIVPDENNPMVKKFRTKGDANNDVDARLVSGSEIIGKVTFSLPHLGYVASYIQKPPGLYVAIAVGIVLIVFVFITDNITTEEKDGKPSKGDERIEMPWLSDLLAKVGITWPKQQPQAPPAQPYQQPYQQVPYQQPYQQPVQYQQPYQPPQYQQAQYPQQGQYVPQQQPYQPQQQYQQVPYQQVQYPQQPYGQQPYQPQQPQYQQPYQPQYQQPPQYPQYAQQPAQGSAPAQQRQRRSVSPQANRYTQ